MNEENWCGQRRPFSSGLTSGSKVSEADVLDVGILVDSVPRSLSAETRLLDSTESGLGGADDTLVHTDHADLKVKESCP